MYFAVLVVLTVVGLGSCQTEPKDQTQALFYAYEKALFTPNGTFCGAVTKFVIPQLWITDEEATQICRNLTSDTVRYAYHPRTCAAFVECDFSRRNPRVCVVHIKAVAAGNYWDAAINAMVIQSPNANCPTNPCKGNKRPITDGQSCSGYHICNETINPIAIENRKCPDGQSFDFNTGLCRIDTNCTVQKPVQETVLSCIPASGPIEGVSYYNRTVRLSGGDNIIQNLPCPSSQVFDVTNLTACQCIFKEQLVCPKSLVSLSSTGSASTTWFSQVNKLSGNAGVSTHPTSYGWGQFNGNTYFSVDSLAGNELTGNFTLDFKFRMSDSTTLNPPRSISLVGNSLESTSCLTPTLDVYLSVTGTNQARVVLNARTALGTLATVSSSNIVSLTSDVSVRVTREGGNLNLEVNGVRTTSTTSLGSIRLGATKCGLVMGASYESNSNSGNLRSGFIGFMDNVSLVLQC